MSKKSIRRRYHTNRSSRMTLSCPPIRTALWKSKCVIPNSSPRAVRAIWRCRAYAFVSDASFSFWPSKFMAWIEPYSSMRWTRCRSKAGWDALGLVIWIRWPNVCSPCCSQNTERQLEANLLKKSWTVQRTRDASAYLGITNTVLVTAKNYFCLCARISKAKEGEKNCIYQPQQN